MDAANKIEICKIVASAILADARITDEEHDFLGKLMDRYGLGEEERKAIFSRNLGEDLGDSVARLRAEGVQNELLVELALAVAVDGDISPSERRLLSRVAHLLDVTDKDLELMLEAAIA
jgi:uncharacterized tellurite resistance protein B-like protein